MGEFNLGLLFFFLEGVDKASGGKDCGGLGSLAIRICVLVELPLRIGLRHYNPGGLVTTRAVLQTLLEALCKLFPDVCLVAVSVRVGAVEDCVLLVFVQILHTLLFVLLNFQNKLLFIIVGIVFFEHLLIHFMGRSARVKVVTHQEILLSISESLVGGGGFCVLHYTAARLVLEVYFIVCAELGRL